jgi:hypothetical protein
MSYAGRPGKRLPDNRIFDEPNDAEVSLEPQKYCYERIEYVKTNCFESRGGAQTCAILVDSEFNCGASGEFFRVYKCSTWKQDGRVLCSVSEVSSERDEEIDPTKERNAMGTPAFSDPSKIETPYAAQAGSFRKEIDAYLLGRKITSARMRNFQNDLDLKFWPRVMEAYISAQKWYRLLLTRPMPRVEVVAFCDKYSSVINGPCQPMPSSLVMTSANR